VTRPGANAAVSHTDTGIPAPTQDESVLSEFDRFRLGRVTRDSEEGWASELRRYLKELPADVTKDTDIIEWWQVWSSFSQLCTVLNPSTSRITLSFIRRLPESPSTSSHVKRLLYLASGFSLQVSRQPMIDGHHWVPSGLRSCS
jgi:hypothetical protein